MAEGKSFSSCNPVKKIGPADFLNHSAFFVLLNISLPCLLVVTIQNFLKPYSSTIIFPLHGDKT